MHHASPLRSAVLACFILAGQGRLAVASPGGMLAEPENVKASVQDNVEILKEILKAGDERIIDEDRFREWSRYPDPDVRTRCALVAGQIGSPRLANVLMGMLSDSSPEVREAAVFALGQAPVTEAVDLLILVFENDRSARVRGRAARALAVTGSPAALKALLTPLQLAWKEPDEKWMVAQILKNLHLLQDPTVIPDVLSYVSDEDPALRFAAVYCLIRLGAPQGAQELIRVASTEKEAEIRAPAVRALGAIEHPGRSEVLRMALKDASWRVRVNALKAMAQTGETDLAKDVAPLLKDENINVRAAAIEALGQLGGPEMLETFARLLADPVNRIQCLAIEEMARACGPDAFPLLHRFRWSEQWELRRAFVTAASRLGKDHILEEMIPQEKDSRILATILSEVSEPPSPGMLAHLFKSLGHKDPIVRAVAAEVLGKIKPEGTLDALLAGYQQAASRDFIPDAKTSILSSLSEFQDSVEAKLALMKALGDRSYVVRLAAVEAARKMGIQGDILDASPVRGMRSDRFYREVVHFSQKQWRARIRTERGDMIASLFAQEAPLTVFNFVKLARTGFYDRLAFHRVVPNFVIQGGCPRGDGWGGPGYSIRSEVNLHPFLRGTLGMALSGKDTGGSQFFITHSAQPHLEGYYTAFGRVEEGLEVLDAIAQGDRILGIDIMEGSEGEISPTPGVSEGRKETPGVAVRSSHGS